MGVLQKLGFVIGLVVAVALMIPLIQSGGPSSQSAANSTAAETVDGKVAVPADKPSVVLAVEPTQPIAAQDGVQDEAPVIDATDVEVVAKEELEAAVPGSDVDLATSAMSKQEPVAAVAQEQAVAVVEDPGLISAATEGAVEELTPSTPVMLDRIFGPFESPGRAKRFAATFADKTGLEVATEKVAKEGWFIVVGYSDDAQRQSQRRTLEKSTGLMLLSINR